MNDLAIAPHVTEAADRTLESTSVVSGRYFRMLRDGTMSQDLFRRTQEQFFFAVTFFPRPRLPPTRKPEGPPHKLL